VYNTQHGYVHFCHRNFDMEYPWLFLGDEVTCSQDGRAVCLSVCPHAVPGHSSLAGSHHIFRTGVFVQAVPFLTSTTTLRKCLSFPAVDVKDMHMCLLYRVNPVPWTASILAKRFDKGIVLRYMKTERGNWTLHDSLFSALTISFIAWKLVENN